MTPLGLISSAIWALVLFWLGNRALDLVQDVLEQRPGSFLGHTLDKMEEDLGPDPLPRRNQIQIPDDLEALAMNESESWARDDMRSVMKERFLELHNGDSDATWQRVRRAMGIGELP